MPLKFYKNDARYGALKDSFPQDCKFFATWDQVPKNWYTKNQLKKMKIKLPDDYAPSGGKRATNGYFPLYEIVFCPNCDKVMNQLPKFWSSNAQYHCPDCDVSVGFIENNN